MGIIRTQINRDGSVSVWNTDQDDKKKKQFYIVHDSPGITASKLKRLNDLRDFNKLKDRDKMAIIFPESREDGTYGMKQLHCTIT